MKPKERIFLSNAKEKHGNKYDYSKVKFERNNKIIIICSKHGEISQKADEHILVGCSECFKELHPPKHKSKGPFGPKSFSNKVSLDILLERIKKHHGQKYSYPDIENEFKDTQSILTIICPKHGSFEQKASSHMNGSGCSICGIEKSGKKTRPLDIVLKMLKDKYEDKFTYPNIKNEYHNISSKVTVVCPKHGEFRVTLNGHLQGTYGCQKCYEETIETIYPTKEQFIEDARKQHGDKFDYSKVSFKRPDGRPSELKVKIICPEHGEFLQNWGGHVRGYGCDECRKDKLFNDSRYPTKEIFIEHARKRFGNLYDYSNVEINPESMKKTDGKVKIICLHHGEFMIDPYLHIHRSATGCTLCGHEIMNLRDTIHNLNEKGIKIKGKFYMLHCFNEYEDFYKIGITTKSVKRRYYKDKKNVSMPYNFNIIIEKEMDIIDAYLIEQGILKKHKQHQYFPKIYFGGITECLSINPIELDKKLHKLYINHSSE